MSPQRAQQILAQYADINKMGWAGEALLAACREERNAALNVAVELVHKYLSYDSQRAVSWHEVNDACDAILALRDQEKP